ncbi:MAG: MBL fold metallo-hydrolase [Clostridia bacterium]|nr:MBL fold metallo-hydrolase [Clostridia bacterium]
MIYTFCRKFANAYLVETRAGIVLVDSGYLGGAKDFWKFVSRKGLVPTDIKAVVITHSHADHVGFLREILDQTGAEVFCHSDHAHVLERGLADYTGIKASSRMMQMVLPHSTAGGGTNNELTPLSKEQLAALHFVDNEEGKALLMEKYGLEALMTPGHTLSCVSYLLEDVAFVGDVAMNIPLTPKLIPFIVSDRDALVSAWETLSTRATVLYLGHGSPILSKQLIARLPDLKGVKIREVKRKE